MCSSLNSTGMSWSTIAWPLSSRIVESDEPPVIDLEQRVEVEPDPRARP